MKLFPEIIVRKFRTLRSSGSFSSVRQVNQITHWDFHSKYLDRPIRIDIFLPPNYYNKRQFYPLLFFNDGQDLEAVQLKNTLNQLYKEDKIRPIVAVGLYANHDRMHEYGTAHRADYKGRGNKAAKHTQFIVKELWYMLYRHYRIDIRMQSAVFAGFSLGGLSAFDIAWNNPRFFGKVGVFSGALWWRSQDFDPGNPDGHRIVHEMVHAHRKRPGMKFWFQAGTKDEAADRNNNGVIDAIDDTLDLMKELRQKGYQPEDMKYLEIEGGEHNQATWARALPDFLIWAFKK